MTMRGKVVNGVLEIYYRKIEEEEVFKVVDTLKMMNYYIVKSRVANDELGYGCFELLRETNKTFRQIKEDYLIAKNKVLK